MAISVTLQGIQQLQRDNARAIRELKRNGILDSVARNGAIQAHRYAVTITHVWHDRGGGLRASHRMEKEEDAKYRVFVDPYTINPRGQRVRDYAYQEHERGGTHAFYARVEQERGQEIGNMMANQFKHWAEFVFLGCHGGH